MPRLVVDQLCDLNCFLMEMATHRIDTYCMIFGVY